eukprot:CAMPEP_0202902088 /NCGR_PEP_ID=MMETSP1392-20130828/16273_1 /ASSEMBLY_ACC=CAM_ASM_000868 /TAXON_ID=225041 /ORGANISM="Chlamydomonas chlamydogama, Strain SAG 11-48b" /LENGTH=112 /DNA_ID=CAMNT_0049588791 /DNA_START=302 /DNA_END=640 /DNA_ORIENTATION=+
MSIPYGAIALVAGAVLFFMGLKDVAPAVAACGLVTSGSSVLSLKQWRQGASSTLYTLVSAGAAGYAGYLAWTKVQAGQVVWLTGSVAVASAALALFCVYNILAGGNPPKKTA